MGVFLAIVAAMLFPAILLSARYDRSLTVYEQLGLIAAATVVVQALQRRSPLEATGRPDRRWVRELALGGAIGTLLMLAPALFLWAGGWVAWSPAATSVDAVLDAVALMAGVAVAEELLFRGVLFQRLIEALGAWPAQLIVAGLFTLTHLSNPGMAGASKLLASTNIFMASILFGFAYLRTRSLALPIGLHFMANTAQGVILGFGVSGTGQPRILDPEFPASAAWLTGGSFGLEASLPGLIAVILTTLWVAAFGGRLRRL